MFNSDWNNDTERKKHAFFVEQSDWLQNSIGKTWIQTGLPYYKVCHEFVQQLVGADMVRQNFIVLPFDM